MTRIEKLKELKTQLSQELDQIHMKSNPRVFGFLMDSGIDPKIAEQAQELLNSDWLDATNALERLLDDGPIAEMAEILFDLHMEIERLQA